MTGVIVTVVAIVTMVLAGSSGGDVNEADKQEYSRERETLERGNR